MASPGSNPAERKPLPGFSFSSFDKMADGGLPPAKTELLDKAIVNPFGSYWAFAWLFVLHQSSL